MMWVDEFRTEVPRPLLLLLLVIIQLVGPDTTALLYFYDRFRRIAPYSTEHWLRFSVSVESHLTSQAVWAR